MVSWPRSRPAQVDEPPADELGIGGRYGLVDSFPSHPWDFHRIPACLHPPLVPVAFASRRSSRRNLAQSRSHRVRTAINQHGARLMVTGRRAEQNRLWPDLEEAMTI